MKKFISLLLLFVSFMSYGIGLTDYEPFSYEVLFTNPVCALYEYEQDVYSNSGNLLTAKPRNVYCKKSDLEISAEKSDSPQHRLIEWIRDRSTKEIFLAYLSFSNRTIEKELCNAIEKRNVKVRFVLHQNTDKKLANELLKCHPKNAANPNEPEVLYRGDAGISGRGTIGYAHNKLFMVNPNSRKKVRMAFSSGNMSSGTVLHHENWHFITTSPDSFFAQAHHCLINGVIDYATDRKTYTDYIAQCKSEIEAEEEDDIKIFFVPGEGEAATAAIRNALRKSAKVSIAAHRFSYKNLVEMLSETLKEQTATIRLVVDDDIYWSGKLRTNVGSNTPFEARVVKKLVDQGLEVKYMETNQNARLLHHNKFIIFDYENDEGAVFAGAGNFTSTAFKSNFENFYFITIPSVVKKFKQQYSMMWNEMATSVSDLPSELIMP